MSPSGEVSVVSDREARIAKRLASWEVELKPGGMVVLSTDVNVTEGKETLVGYAKAMLRTWYQRLTKSRKVDEELSEMVRRKGLETGWSIGNLFRGRYLSPKSGQVFNEKSFAVDVRGVDFEFVREAGKALGRRFGQESVLLVDHSNGKTFLTSTA